jgi:hypothetical protein
MPVNPVFVQTTTISQSNVTYVSSFPSGSSLLNVSLNPVPLSNLTTGLVRQAGPLQQSAPGFNQPAGNNVAAIGTSGGFMGTSQLSFHQYVQQSPLDAVQKTSQMPALAAGYASKNLSVIGNNATANATGTTGGQPSNVDRRIRIRAVTGQEADTYGYTGTSPAASIMGILNPNTGSNGVVFPYTPVVTYNNGAEYTSVQPTHSNQEYYVYTRTPSVQIQISGAFTAQNQQEAAYSLAVMHFCKSMVKMNFGVMDQNRGTPPRTLLLSGYGVYMFNDLPILFKDFSINLDKDVDYVQTILMGANAWVPTYWTLTVNVIVQNTPNNWKNNFSLSNFKNGNLLRTQKGWI